MAVDLTVRKGETKEQYRVRVREELRVHDRKQRMMLAKGELPVVMDVDDFGFLLPGYDDLLSLKKSFPNFKITAFTIPLPKEFYHGPNAKQLTSEKYRKWAAIVNQQDWIEVAVHGFSHTHYEMETSYTKAIDTLTAVERFFEQVGLEYKKIFRAPYWQYSYDALMALRDKGYVVAIDRNHQRPVPPGLKTYVYNWSYEERLPDADVIKGHGHFTGQNQNNISATLANILHWLPRDTRFMTISEYLAKQETLG